MINICSLISFFHLTRFNNLNCERIIFSKWHVRLRARPNCNFLCLFKRDMYIHLELFIYVYVHINEFMYRSCHFCSAFPRSNEWINELNGKIEFTIQSPSNLLILIYSCTQNIHKLMILIQCEQESIEKCKINRIIWVITNEVSKPRHDKLWKWRKNK